MAQLVGIDLGTTNSCVAAVRDGTPEILRDSHGNRTLPSVVARARSGEWLVGAPAKRQAVTNPTDTVYGVKRLVGQRFDAPRIAEWSDVVPYRIVEGDGGDAWVRIAGHAMSPPEVCAHVLRTIKAVAEQRLGATVDGAVITVPAYFDDAQRQATRDAGAIAGLDVAAIVNEPTAAALAYGPARSLDGARVAVFDLGGGTFDVSILKIEAGVYEVLATHGDTLLGGDDFDRVLIDELARRCGQEYGVDVRANPMALQRLKEAAEIAKADLSAMAAADIALPFLADGPGGPVNLEHRFERAWFERACAPLLARLDRPCTAALADAGLAAGDIDCVILVGGMTRMPAVQARAEDLFGRAPARDVNPDEIVALGAATHAATLAGASDAVVLLDVTPHALGVKVDDDRMSVIVPRNTTLPVSESREYRTLTDDQSHVRVDVYQGDSDCTADNRFLGSVTLRGLPPGPAGAARVDVGFDIDTDGIVCVVARSTETGETATAELEHASGLSRQRVDQLSGRTPTTRATAVASRLRSVVPAPEWPATTAEGSGEQPLVPDFFDSPPTVPNAAPPPPASRPSGRMTAASTRAPAANRRHRRTSAGYGFVSEQSRRITATFRQRRVSARVRTARPTREPVCPVKRDYEFAAKSDLFAQLGVHWTDAPTKLEPSLQALRKKYGSRSSAAATAPEWAAKRLALAEAAYAQLSSVGGRRAYRADTLRVDVKSAASLLVQQARLDIRRADLDDAIEKLTAAMDLDPTTERRHQLDALLQQKRS